MRILNSNSRLTISYLRISLFCIALINMIIASKIMYFYDILFIIALKLILLTLAVKLIIIIFKLLF